MSFDKGLAGFFIEHSVKIEDSIYDDDEPEVQKLFSGDSFDVAFAGINNLVGGSPFVLGNAGGGDTLFSLVANIANVTNDVSLLVVDRNIRNIKNFLFRYLLVQVNPTPAGCLSDMLGLADVALAKVILNGKDKDAIRDAIKTVVALGFDPSLHASNIFSKLHSGNFPVEYAELVSEAVREIGHYIHSYGIYGEFVEGVLSAIENNPETHYLASSGTYKALHSIPEGSVHVIRRDMDKAGDMKKIRGLVSKSKGSVPVDIAFIPDSASLTGAIPFLSEESNLVVSRVDKSKTIVIAESSELVPTPHQVRGLSKYKKVKLDRKPIKGLKKLPPGEGLENTLVMTHLEIGSIYSDETAILDMIDIANARGATLWVTGGALFGPKIYRGKKERQLVDPEFSSFDSQLRKFKEYVNRFNGNVIYIPLPLDWENMIDLKTIFIKEFNAKKTGKVRFELNISQREQDYLIKFEESGRIIIERYFPTLLRLGEDPGLYTEEVNVEGGTGRNNIRYMTREGISIVDMVKALERLDTDKSLLPIDDEIMETIGDAVENSPKLSVFSDYSGFSDSETQRPLRLLPDTQFSGQTAYSKPYQVILQLHAMQGSGILNDVVKEPFLIDLQQCCQLVRISSSGATIGTAHMVDDMRYFDSDFSSPSFKRTPGSHVHKRCSKPKPIVNVPSATLVSGSPEERVYFEMYPPMIVDRLRSRQGKQKDHRDTSILVFHDNQVGSYTERLRFHVKAYDYGFHERGCVAFLGVGDRIQGRNYGDFPNEASPGAVPIAGQKKAIVELARPYFTLPQIELWGEVEGNHERNSDWTKQGHHYLDRMEEALTTHKLTTGRDIQIAFPQWVKLKNGDIARTPFGYAKINGYKMVYAHQFGKGGDATVPATIAAEWKRKMGGTSRDFDISFMGHYHHFNVLQLHNCIHCMLGGQAGASGYEIERQCQAEPSLCIVTIEKSGMVRFEFITDAAMRGYDVQNPTVKEKGLDTFIDESISLDVYPFHEGDGKPMQEFFVRRPNIHEPVNIE